LPQPAYFGCEELFGHKPNDDSDPTGAAILPAPETLVIEADEYLFTLAAAMSEIMILQDCLTHYCVHGGNLYLSAGHGEEGLRRKQQVLEPWRVRFEILSLAKEFLPKLLIALLKSYKRKPTKCV